MSYTTRNEFGSMTDLSVQLEKLGLTVKSVPVARKDIHEIHFAIQNVWQLLNNMGNVYAGFAQ